MLNKGDVRVSINQFADMWSSKNGTLYVLDCDDYDSVDDAIQIARKTDIMDILNESGATPYFSIWEGDIMYKPSGFIRPEWYNATVYTFISIPSGIIAFIDYDDVRDYKMEVKDNA